MKYLIDGIDRLGKSTLAKMISNDQGYHVYIHYDKPKVLAQYLTRADTLKRLAPHDYFQMTDQQVALMLYQEAANTEMFNLLKSNIRLVIDRTHLGEMVYAPLYRNYSGDYIYKMEEDALTSKQFKMGTKLILLTTSNFDMLEDDGESFDFSKKEEEQKKFIEAFNRSKIKNKVMIDVHNGNGGYKTYEEIYREATNGNN